MKNLFFWKGIERGSFIKVDDGWMFSPYGIFGKSYKIDEPTMHLLTSYLRWYYRVSALVIVAIIALGLTPLEAVWRWSLTGILLVVWYAWYYFKIKAELKEFEPVAKGPSRRERQEKMISTMSHGRINFILVGAIFMTVFGGFIALQAAESRGLKDILSASFLLLLGLAGLVVGTWYKRVKRRLVRE